MTPMGKKVLIIVIIKVFCVVIVCERLRIIAIKIDEKVKEGEEATHKKGRVIRCRN